MLRAICSFAVLICAPMGIQDAQARPQFEVASVRPAAPLKSSGQALDRVFIEAKQSRVRKSKFPLIGADRMRLSGWSLLDLISVAYEISASQVSGPKWLFDTSYDIEAKVPDGTPPEQLNAMMRSLLEDRFSLKTHRATQTAQGYALTVDKNGSRLIPVPEPPNASGKNGDDPTLSNEARTGQAMKGLSDMNDRIDRVRERSNSQPGLTILSWSPITIKEFAQNLSRLTQLPVVDVTSLKGQYSITIDYSKNSDTSGKTISEAVQDLGLTLQPRKVTFEVLIVDQVNKSPTAN